MENPQTKQSRLIQIEERINRVDELLQNPPENQELLNVGLGIRLALGMGKEILLKLSAGSQTADMVRDWVREHGEQNVNHAISLSKHFLLEPKKMEELIKQGLQGKGME